MRAILVCLVFATATALALTYPTGSIISITDMDNSDMKNYLMRFDSTNATAPYNIVEYPYYEFTTAGALDLVRGRYLLMYESEQIGFYNITTLEQIEVKSIPAVGQLPDAMHYDANTDTVWLVQVFEDTFSICSISSDFDATNCVATVSGQFSYTADSSTYDPNTGLLYVQLQSMNSGGGQPLFVFNTATNAVSAPIPLIDLCLGMNIATINGAATLTCVDFITNLFVSVDTTTGKFTKLFTIDGTPQPYTAYVYNDAASGSSTLFAELEGFLGQSRWTSYDVATGTKLAETEVQNGMQLELPMYIPPNTF